MTSTMNWVTKRKVIAIVRGLPAKHMQGLTEALYAGGIDLIEVTFNQARKDTWADTAQAIEYMARHMADRVLPGAGTVINREQLALAQKAGAQYIVTPNTNPELIEEVKKAGLCCFPGALTPSEIVTAYNAGADAVKVFPVGALGAGYIKAVGAPLGHIPLMAVGGVNEKNAAQFMAAGCVGIGVGGSLVNKQWIEEGQWDRITALAAAYRKAVDGL